METKCDGLGKINVCTTFGGDIVLLPVTIDTDYFLVLANKYRTPKKKLLPESIIYR